jgi:hypothetical protein
MRGRLTGRMLGEGTRRKASDRSVIRMRFCSQTTPRRRAPAVENAGAHGRGIERSARGQHARTRPQVDCAPRRRAAGRGEGPYRKGPGCAHPGGVKGGGSDATSQPPSRRHTVRRSLGRAAALVSV